MGLLEFTLSPPNTLNSFGVCAYAHAFLTNNSIFVILNARSASDYLSAAEPENEPEPNESTETHKAEAEAKQTSDDGSSGGGQAAVAPYYYPTMTDCQIAAADAPLRGNFGPRPSAGGPGMNNLRDIDDWEM